MERHQLASFLISLGYIRLSKIFVLEKSKGGGAVVAGEMHLLEETTKFGGK